MAILRKLVQRAVIVAMWISVGLGAIGGFGYPAASVWLERNTILVHVVDSDGYPIADAEVCKVPLASLEA